MSRILPFAGLRYNAAVAPDLARVVCPPYDVIAAAEAARLRAASPYNAIHIELPIDTPGQPDSRYRAAAERLGTWLATGVLRPDSTPAFTLHETRFAARGRALRRRDLVAAVPVEPWSSGAVLAHERTFSGPKADRLALLAATRTNVSPIWLLHRERVAALDQAWLAAERSGPTAAFSLPDGEHHRLWVVHDPALVAAVAGGFNEGVAQLYVADGHHRYETALAYKAEAGAGLPGAAATLAVVTHADDPGLGVLPTHRLLRHLQGGSTPARVAQRLAHLADAQWLALAPQLAESEVDALMARLAAAGGAAPSFAVFGRGDGGLVGALLTCRPGAANTALPAGRSDAWRSLDVALVHALVVDPLVAETGQAADAVLRYTRDPREALAAVGAGSASLALLLNPTPVAQVLAVADAADRMPEKSTYFYPKPPTGLVLRSLAAP